MFSNNNLFYLLLKSDLKTIPPGFESGMNFGSSDVDLNLAAALKPKGKRADEEAQSVEMLDESESIIDLADLLKEKVSIFKWIAEEPSPSIPSMSFFSHLKFFLSLGLD